jgi:hypothetical protein
VKLNISRVPALLEFMSGYTSKGSRLFLATDNYQVRQMARARLGDQVWHTGGPIVHIDRQARLTNACDGFGFALVDQLILTHCDVLLYPDNSGFSRFAAFQHKGPGLFVFNQAGDIREIKPWQT